MTGDWQCPYPCCWPPTSPEADCSTAPQPTSEAEPRQTDPVWNRRIINAFHVGIRQGRMWGLQDAAMATYYWPNMTAEDALADAVFACERVQRWSNIARLEERA